MPVRLRAVTPARSLQPKSRAVGSGVGRLRLETRAFDCSWLPAKNWPHAICVRPISRRRFEPGGGTPQGDGGNTSPAWAEETKGANPVPSTKPDRSNLGVSNRSAVVAKHIPFAIAALRRRAARVEHIMMPRSRPHQFGGTMPVVVDRCLSS